MSITIKQASDDYCDSHDKAKARTKAWEEATGLKQIKEKYGGPKW